MIADCHRVAMLCQGGEVYGIGTIQKLYARGMPGLNFVCMGEGPLTDWLRRDGYRVDVVGGPVRFSAGSSVGTLLRLPRALLAARRAAERIHELLHPRGVRIVHTHWLPQQLIAGFMRPLGYKSVWQINNNTNRSRLWGLGVRLNHLMARWGADLLLPASDFIADNWRGSGVQMRTIRNAAEKRLETPSSMPAMPPVKCLIAGRLERSKGHHVAVEAVIAARKRGAEVTLDIFGGPVDDNPYADSLRARIAEAGCGGAIHVMGFQETLRQFHPQYHLGLQCRLDPEPCSLWVCETLVDGLPLLAAANGGTPELVSDGETGVLFRSGDAAELSRILLELATNPSRLAAMRAAAFERGRSSFTASRLINETLAAYVGLR